MKRTQRISRGIQWNMNRRPRKNLEIEIPINVFAKFVT